MMHEENEGDLYEGYNEFNPLLDTEVPNNISI